MPPTDHAEESQHADGRKYLADPNEPFLTVW
jgi:hypothetical protein